MSKGSNSRPFSITDNEYSARWDAIFKKPVEKPVIEVITDPQEIREIFEKDEDVKVRDFTRSLP